jgi:WD40 repeat protein
MRTPVFNSHGLTLKGFILYLFVAGLSAQAQTVKPYPRIETGTHAAPVRRIDVDASERFLVSASDDKTARVWDLNSGSLLKILRPPIGEGNDGKLFAVAVSPDGTSVAVGGFLGAPGAYNYPIYVFDRASGAIRRALNGLPGATKHLAYSKDGRYLAAALGGSNGIRVFETGGYSETARDAAYGDDSYWAEFDKSGSLVTASYDGFVRLYSPDFHLLHKAKPPGGRDPYSARFSPDGKLIAVGFNDTMAVSVISGADLSPRYSSSTPSGGGDLGSALWSQDGATICAGGLYHTSDAVHPVLCWDGQRRGRRTAFPVTGNTIMDLRALHDGAIAFCSGDGVVGVLDRRGTLRWRTTPDILDYLERPSALRISSDGSRVVADSTYFNGTAWTPHTVGFSISDQRLEIDGTSQSSLQTPITNGLAIDGWQNDEHPKLDGHPLRLESYEISRALAIAPGKDSFVLGTGWYVRKFDKTGEQLWVMPAPGTAWGVNISADGRFVVASLGDGTIRWYTFDKGDEVLALFIDRDLRRWVAWNPDGFFNSKGGGDSLIGYQINRSPGQEGEFVKVDQLREVFYQPDLIAQILKPGGAPALASARTRLGDISRILSGGLPPEIELISPVQANLDGDYQLQFRLKDMGGGVGRVVYRIDGAETDGRAAVDIRGTAGDVNSRTIPIAAGEHTLTVAAYDAKGKIEGPPKTIHLNRTLPPRGSNLYVLAAGVSHYSDNSLSQGVKFAAADAELIAARFKAQEGKGLYPKVIAVSLPDSQATLRNIEAQVAQMAKTVQPGDTFILYLAGHGVAADGEYYFIPWEAEYTNQKDLLAKSVNREKIQALLKQMITNKSVLILDTCGAGAYFPTRASDSEKASQERIAAISGHAVLAASNSDEMAMEGYQNHGVFTYALLEGLQQAEGTAQGEILITRLAEYVQSRVPALTLEKWKYRQAPLSRIDGEPFPIAHKVN